MVSWHSHLNVIQRYLKQKVLFPKGLTFKGAGAGGVVVRALASHLNVARVRFPFPASYVGWVCCLFPPLSERFFSGYSGFPLSSKTNTARFQFDLECRDTCWTSFWALLRCSISNSKCLTVCDVVQFGKEYRSCGRLVKPSEFEYVQNKYDQRWHTSPTWTISTFRFLVPRQVKGERYVGP